MTNAQAIMEHQTHRPWAMPTAPWLMQQTWENLLFAHWPVDAAALQLLLPDGLIVDTFEGQAWVSVVPFQLTYAIRQLQPLPIRFHCAEINLRTYVKRRVPSHLCRDSAPENQVEKPGVYFFSLDASSSMTVAMAKRFFKLPYHKAQIAVDVMGGQINFDAQREEDEDAITGAEFSAIYTPCSKCLVIEPDCLTHWLTERYCFYTTDGDGLLYRGDVHHQPWALQKAELVISENTLPTAYQIQLPDNVSPLCHFAKRMDVLAWPVERLGEF